MFRISDNHAVAAYHASDKCSVAATKFSRLDENGKPAWSQSVKSVRNTPQHCNHEVEMINLVIKEIETSAEELGIHFFSPDINKQSLASQLTNIRVYTRSSKNRTDNDILHHSRIAGIEEQNIERNKQLIEQIAKVDKPFIRINKGKVKGYNTGFWHSFKTITSAHYRSGVLQAKRLAAHPTADNIKQKLISHNSIKETIVAEEHQHIASLAAQRLKHVQLLDKLTEAKTRLENLQTADTLVHPSGLTGKQLNKLGELLTELSQARKAPPQAGDTDTPAQSLKPDAATVASVPTAVKARKKPAPPAPPPRSPAENN